MGIFETLDWLVKKVDRLCCAVKELQQNTVYKTYVVSLTQNGSDMNTQEIFGGDLTIGQTYLITGGGGNFSNVGAPNNNPGTYFIATGTTPLAWNGGLLSFISSYPIAITLENTIGAELYWERQSEGAYLLHGIGKFPLGKTFCLINQGNSYSEDAIYYAHPYNNDLIIVNSENINYTKKDDKLFNTSLEIRVYN